MSIFRTLDDHWGVSAIHYHLGLALHRAGRLEAALDAYEEALTEGRRVGRANTVQYALANIHMDGGRSACALQICSPALAEIMGGRRLWTVSMISAVSIPWR